MASPEFSNPLRKFKLVFLGEQSGKYRRERRMKKKDINEKDINEK